MRQGSILAFLQARTPRPDSKETQPTITVTAIAGQSTPVSDSIERSTADRQAYIHHELQRQHHVDSQSEIKQGLFDKRCMIVQVLPLHIDRLKSITATLLPVRYSDKFFAECLEPDKYSVMAAVALYDLQVVGWIRCRVEPFPNAENEVYQQIYIQALGILAPFRGLGLATQLLKTIQAKAASTHGRARSIYAHVWESNEDALAWYDKQGFARIMLQPQYYRRLKPAGAWIVRNELECSHA